MSIVTDDSMPLLLGLAIAVIILVAVFSKGGDEEKAKKEGKKKEAVAPASTSASKKSKKSKKSSAPKQQAAKAAPPAEEKKPVVIEETPPPQAVAEPETSTASKKKKKKVKKKASSGTATKTTEVEAPPAKTAVTFSPATVDDDSDSDDDVDLWRIQSASKRKGANDAVKRSAANKEKERERRAQALKKQEEKEKAAAAAEKARKEQEEAEEAALAAAEQQAKKKVANEEQAKPKKNGASVAPTNGETADAAAATGEKKKRKRKKKKVVDEEVVAKKTDAPAEVWETVPVVEEWQEVGTKKTKPKANVQLNILSTDIASADDAANEDSGETSVSISAGDDPLIFIGRGGSTIQNLQATTGARFDLNRDTKVLTISGLEECVQQGLAEARSILAAEADRKANETTEKVTWGSDAIKAVIGRGGSNIRSTQDATGVRIDADVDAGTLVINGPRDQVSAALTMCHNAAFGESQDVLELGSRNAVNVVYGPNFQTIREMQDSTGCKLEITRGTTTLKLSGSNEAVADATARVRALLDANRGFDMTIENSKVGAVYGKGGETLRSIQDRTGVQIDVERGPTHASVSVMGTKEASERARHMLQRAIDGEVELGPGEVAEEIELGSATAAVIGRGGSNVADLEKRHGVKVNVRSELRVARIVGKPEKVAAASKDILAIAKPILDAENAQKKADDALETGDSAWQVEAEDDEADGW